MQREPRLRCQTNSLSHSFLRGNIPSQMLTYCNCGVLYTVLDAIGAVNCLSLQPSAG